MGSSATVRFTTADGTKVTTRVVDPASDTELAPGFPLRVRYDPSDPAGRVESADDSQRMLSRLFYIGCGFGLLALVGYGAG
jgi:hypothetical protein